MKQRTALIFETNTDFAKSLNEFLTNNSYNVIGISDNTQYAIELIQKHNPNIITSALKLRGGSGVKIFDFLAHYVTELEFSPLVVVISTHMNPTVRNYINTQFHNTKIEVIYFNKCDFSPQSLLIMLSLKESYIIESSKIKRPSRNSRIVKSENKPVKSLDATIRELLISYKISVDSRAFEYLVYMIKHMITLQIEGEARLTMNELYTLAADKFSRDVSTIEKGIHRLLTKAFPKIEKRSFSTTPKRFIERIVNESKTRLNL